MNGIIVIDKPKDFTSFDVVAVMRKLCNQKKIGHTGTLDPMATGVLPILLGKATKAQDILPCTDKEYHANFKLGISTDTLDITGTILKTTECKNIKTKDILAVLENYKGDIMQIPPMYSAVKKDGVRLYDLARKGVEVERVARPITIRNLELLSFNEETFEGVISVRCSKGTYIRTLVDDIGNDLNVGATLTQLRRTFACGYTLDDAVTLEEMREISKSQNILPLSIESLFTTYESVNLSVNQSTRFSNGGNIDINRTNLRNISDNQILRVKSSDDKFIGLGKICMEINELKIYKMF